MQWGLGWGWVGGGFNWKQQSLLACILFASPSRPVAANSNNKLSPILPLQRNPLASFPLLVLTPFIPHLAPPLKLVALSENASLTPFALNRRYGVLCISTFPFTATCLKPPNLSHSPTFTYCSLQGPPLYHTYLPLITINVTR